jgi:nitroreductase
MELLNNHVTIRNFKDVSIATELLNSILYAGTRASTSGNMQLYSIVISRDQEMRKKLAPLHFNQPVAVNAPVLLTIIADVNRFTSWCQNRNAHAGYNNFLSFNNALIDASLVAQNICIAAENAGLGICYLGTTLYNADSIIKLLELPKLTFPVTTIALGYPKETPELTDRLPLKGIIHNEVYTNYATEVINELYKNKENLESSLQFVKENNKDNLAQVFTDVRYKKADNEFFSNKMMEVLNRQGFLGE